MIGSMRLAERGQGPPVQGVGVGDCDDVRAGPVHLCVDGERRLVDVVAPLDDLALAVDQDQFVRRQSGERGPEGVDPEAVGEFRVACGDVTGDAVLVPELTEQPERPGQPFLAVRPLVGHGLVDGRQREVELVHGYGCGLGHGGSSGLPGRTGSEVTAGCRKWPGCGTPGRYDDAAARRASGGIGVDPGSGGARREGHSHSMVPGGLLVTSSTTRLTSATSLVMRVEIRARVSYGRRDQSAVMASSEETGRSTIGWP